MRSNYKDAELNKVTHSENNKVYLILEIITTWESKANNDDSSICFQICGVLPVMRFRLIDSSVNK